MERLKLINEIKAKWRWFTHKEKEGILAYNHEVYPDTEFTVYGTYFYPFEVLTTETLQKFADDTLSVCTTYLDSYSGGTCENGEEIEEGLMVNRENEQRLVDVWETVRNLETDKAERELTVFTTAHHEWSSELTGFADDIFRTLERIAKRVGNDLEAIITVYNTENGDDDETAWTQTVIGMVGDHVEEIDNIPSFDEILDIEIARLKNVLGI
jgi:hypothetical protein